jgi:hypothetical protein
MFSSWRLFKITVLAVCHGGLKFPGWLLLLLGWTGNRPIAAMLCGASMLAAVKVSGVLLKDELSKENST